MALDHALYGLAFCNSVPLKADGSGAVQPCSTLDNDAADRLGDVEARRRQKVIMEGVSEWRRLGPGMLRQNPHWSWRAWVNASLTEAGLPPLTAAETKEYDS